MIRFLNKNLIFNRSYCLHNILKFSTQINDAVEIKNCDENDVNKSENNLVGKRNLIKKVKTILGCEHEDAVTIVEKNNFNNDKTLKNILNLVEYLYGENISNSTILKNKFLLNMDKKIIQAKLCIIKNMSPRDLDDFIPLLKLDFTDLAKIEKIMIYEKDLVYGGNRIYFFSDKLNVPPQTVAKYFSTHAFMFEISLLNFYKNLKVFLDYKVEPMNILRDLWAFKYKTKSIERRLERAKTAQKDKIMPWMVRCTEPILQKSLQIATESKALLGESNSTLEYLSNRLGYDLKTTEYIVSKHPQVLKVRIPKINEIIDYLLNEANFTPHHIAQVPRILCHSLETTKFRLNELKSYGCVPSTLVILCKSNREYAKFRDKWISSNRPFAIRIK